MRNVLIVTVFITNNSLNPVLGLGKARTYSEVERLEIFFSSLHSWSSLKFESSLFFVELDADYIKYQELVKEEIQKAFPSALLQWRRLNSFLDWQEISINPEVQNSELITLIANDDHAYVHKSPKYFNEFAQEIVELSGSNKERALGDLTHFPGAIRLLSLYSHYRQPPLENQRELEVTTVHGCCLVTPALFREWWATDFTNASRIPRPDNPFGPSVHFAPSILKVPKIELMRHLDGYGEGSRVSQRLNVLRPTCRISTGDMLSETIYSVTQRKWTYCSWPTRIDFYRGSSCDLYELEISKGNILEGVRVDVGRLKVAFQKVYAPKLTKELLSRQDRKLSYRFLINLLVISDLQTLCNFLIWIIFDLPNQILIRMVVATRGIDSYALVILKKIRSQIFKWCGVSLLTFPFRIVSKIRG